MDKDKVKEILEPEINKLYRDAHGKKYAEISIKASINIICDRIAAAICQLDEQDRLYPCADCGKLRTKDEGGATFAVCDECWDKLWQGPGQRPAHRR